MNSSTGRSPENEIKILPAFEGAIITDGATWTKKLVGGQCRYCELVTLGKKVICPGCWSRDAQNEVALSGAGRFYSYTIVRHPPRGFEGPYAIAYVDLPENLRLLVRADVDLVSRLKVGDQVTIDVARIASSQEGEVTVGPVLCEYQPDESNL